MTTIVTGYMSYKNLKKVVKSIKDRNTITDGSFILVNGNEFPLKDSLPDNKDDYQFSTILNYLDDGTKRLDIAFQMIGS